jgi:hypothetical protein
MELMNKKNLNNNNELENFKSHQELGSQLKLFFF